MGQTEGQIAALLNAPHPIIDRDIKMSFYF